MNSENSNTSKPHILKLKLTDKLGLRLDKKVIALSNHSIHYTWNNIKNSYSNNKFKILAPTWNEEFTLPDGFYSVSDIQDYFENILKKHGENTDKIQLLFEALASLYRIHWNPFACRLNTSDLLYGHFSKNLTASTEHLF